MRLHGLFEATSPAGSVLVDSFNSEAVFDGAYSRVVCATPYSVLKATACGPTQQLLRKLRATKPMLSLPCVLDRKSGSLRDSDGVLYEVWELERLFERTALTEMRHARAYGRGRLEGFKPAYRGRSARLSIDLADDLAVALKEEQAYWGHENSAQASAEIALAMSLRTEGELRDTFLFLRHFVKEHRVGLDLLTQGNFLWNLFGEVCLSDPVCEDDREGEAPADVQSGTCVCVWVPVRVKGTRLTLAPKSTFGLSDGERAKLQDQLSQAGLQTLALRWGTPEHEEFLRSSEREVAVWAVPDAGKRLREGYYDTLLVG